MQKHIPFNRPYMTGKELYYIADAHFRGKLSGDGVYTKNCHSYLENHTSAKKVLLTHSCTAALEMAALLLNIEPGDEIIMPSYTFVSTANAFVLRGAVPIFVDIKEDTLNLNEELVKAAVSKKTKAIVPVHYAGVSCDMDIIIETASRYNIKVIEDAAQGVMSKYRNKFLGTLGDLGTYSFHETKNVISGEGGALLINQQSMIEQAEIIREKGTDRSRFFQGKIDKYTWQEFGSSYLPGELISAFLWAQLQEADFITSNRLKTWNKYHQKLEAFERLGKLRRPIIPEYNEHNAHMYYVLINDSAKRQSIIDSLKKDEVDAVFHYVPLHDSPAGKRFGRIGSEMEITNSCSSRILRLPLWVGMEDCEIDRVVSALERAVNNS